MYKEDFWKTTYKYRKDLNWSFVSNCMFKSTIIGFMGAILLSLTVVCC